MSLSNSFSIPLRMCTFALLLFLINARHRSAQVPSGAAVAYPSAFVEKSSFSNLMYINSTQESEKPTVTIVIYDKVVGYLNWIHNEFKAEALSSCNTKCIISNRRDEVHKADVVMFHAPTHGKMRPVYPPQRPNNAIYGIFSMEQPKYAPMLANIPLLQSKFDFTVTYSLEKFYPGTESSNKPLPNIPVTYFPLHTLPIEWITRAPRPTAEKTGYATGVNVAVFVSNCKNAGAAQRAEYLKELMNEIPVHSYGKCLHNRDEPNDIAPDPLWPDYDQKRSRKMVILSHYKFYLSFENLQIDDYVSEKVYEGLYSGSVPVYRGAPRISRFMPNNHSFIDANMMSPKQLAAELKRLSLPENQQEYESYLDYKAPIKSSQAAKPYEVGSRKPSPGDSTSSNVSLGSSFIDIAYMSYIHPMIACRICDYAQSLKK